MPRKRKQVIKVNDTESLEGLMQEIYNDACVEIRQAQNTINSLTNGVIPEDVDDSAKIAKEKSNAQKIKNDSIKIKLEVAKLQSDVIKHNGNIEETNKSRVNTGEATVEDFKEIRNMMKNMNKERDN